MFPFRFPPTVIGDVDFVLWGLLGRFPERVEEHQNVPYNTEQGAELDFSSNDSGPDFMKAVTKVADGWLSNLGSAQLHLLQIFSDDAPIFLGKGEEGILDGFISCFGSVEEGSESWT